MDWGDLVCEGLLLQSGTKEFASFLAVGLQKQFYLDIFVRPLHTPFHTYLQSLKMPVVQ
jgi:hypothetical protein